MTRWIWVSLPHATFGLAVNGGKVTGAAPIARWAVGKDEEEVAAYLRRRGACFWTLDDMPRPQGAGETGEDPRGRPPITLVKTEEAEEAAA